MSSSLTPFLDVRLGCAGIAVAQSEMRCVVKVKVVVMRRNEVWHEYEGENEYRCIGITYATVLAALRVPRRSGRRADQSVDRLDSRPNRSHYRRVATDASDPLIQLKLANSSKKKILILHFSSLGIICE